MKYIICYTGGGFNDMLNGIDVCFKHALKYNRILVIDSTQVSWFKDDIHKYIDFTHPIIYKDNINELYTKLELLHTYPTELKGKLKTMKIYYKKYTFMAEGDIPTSINLNRDYNEDVIIYSNCGGHISTEIFNYIKFKPLVKNVYFDRLLQLPSNYISIHIRNTDKRCCSINTFTNNYEKLLLNNKFFLGTDDYKTLQLYKEKFKDTLIHFSNIPLNEDGKNIHYYHDNIDQELFIVDCIVDLLLLASANEYYFSTKDSGYSNFANFLFNNKHILNNMLN